MEIEALKFMEHVRREPLVSTGGGEFILDGYQPVRRSTEGDRHTEAHDLESLAALVTRYAGPSTVIYWQAGADVAACVVRASLDDGSRRDFISLKFAHSAAFRGWLGLSGGVGVKGLRKFLQARGAEVVTPGFLDACKRININLIFTYVEEGSDEFTNTFLVKSAEGEGTLKLPSEVEVLVPVFMGSPRKHAILFDLEHKLGEGGKGLSISLIARDAREVVDRAMEAEIEALKTAVPETVLVVRGAP